LIEQLDRGAGSKFTLVSAPPGFGKTTLLADWLAAVPADRRSVAWLSLDPSDNDPATFWSYLIAALQQALPDDVDDVRPLLDSPQAPIEVVLTALLNKLSTLPNDLVLVLDDYHLIDVPAIHDGVAFLVDHLPRSMHVIMTTRADPPLPLARLRARGELVEVRAADLRFTPDEAAAYLIGAMGLVLTARDIAALEARTEGWIAALQLAALSMQGRSDVADFIAGFAGDDRYIVDYLVDEVLHRQPERLRTFLLRTSVLDRLTGPLCDAVTGQGGGKATLEALDRGNLFLVPLDDRRRWYRYHHLFADVLRAHLRDEEPDVVPALHRRASAWYEENGEPAEAIGHALAAEDYERAADLVELTIPTMFRTRQEMTIRRWMAALPEGLFGVRPVLSVGYAGALMSTATTEGVDRLLRAAERWLPAAGGAPDEPPSSEGMVVVDEAEFRRLPGAVAMYRAALALAVGDLPGTLTHAARALDLADEDNHFGRGAAGALLGLAQWTAGDLEAAYGSFAGGMANLERAGFLADVVGGAVTLADLRMAQGRLEDALRLYARGLEVATEPGRPVLRGAADMHVGIADILCERDDLPGAVGHLLASQELGEANGLPKHPWRSRVAMARIRQAEGDLDGAAEFLGEAEHRYTGDFSPDVRPIAAMRTRLWIAQGKLSEASSWAHERGLSAADDLGYVGEFSHATLARLLVAEGARDADDQMIREAVELTDRLLAAADDGGRNGSAIDILVAQALARQALRDVDRAVESLVRAVELAEPEGYVRIFIDEGRPMVSLLQAAITRGIGGEYVRVLLSASRGTERRPIGSQRLVETLSERELDVLRLLAGDLSGPDIARELFVSLNTLRTHTKSVYAKLGVNNRRAAVRRASELDLL
jgi:LuxR family maltose regulon positive regulatory protein